MTDWSSVRSDAIQAAQGVLGGAWNAASAGATAQITQLVQTAQYIEENSGSMTSDESQFLMTQQKTALQNVLTAYASIAIAAAINTVNAVVNKLLTDVPALVGFI
jgi:hypothetical protein